ncbi:MAG: DUF368 domain-containing protein [Planctomycetota bacterium]
MPEPAEPGHETIHDAPDATPLGGLVARSALGGALMGLANLVPGISGGTMLLAAGVYPRFIGAIGEVTTLKFRKASVVVLGTVVVAAVLAIGLLAGVVKTLVVEQRWAMYSLFIGLTLGGVPVVWRLLKQTEPESATASREPQTPSAARGSGWLIAAIVGFVAMAALALVQSSGAAGSGSNDGFVFMLLAGIAGAAAMILPGVSGGYLLLVLGVYVPILAGIDAFIGALSARDLGALWAVGVAVILPVGVGVLIGVIGVSNLLRWLLARYERATLGVLLGLLLGAVVGLWPFQQSVEPEVGMVVKGQRVVLGQVGDPEGALTTGYVYEASRQPVATEDLPTEFFTPGVGQAGGAAGLLVLGFVVTMGVDRLGREKPSKSTNAQEG